MKHHPIVITVALAFVSACSTAKTEQGPTSGPNATEPPDGGKAPRGAVDRSQLGPECPNGECAEGHCVYFGGFDPPTFTSCITAADPCTIVTCYEGYTCSIADDSPPQVACDPISTAGGARDAGPSMGSSGGSSSGGS